MKRFIKKKYFTIIYSFEEVLEIICMTQKIKDICLQENSPKTVHFDVDLKINIFELL